MVFKYFDNNFKETFKGNWKIIVKEELQEKLQTELQRTLKQKMKLYEGGLIGNSFTDSAVFDWGNQGRGAGNIAPPLDIEYDTDKRNLVREKFETWSWHNSGRVSSHRGSRSARINSAALYRCTIWSQGSKFSEHSDTIWISCMCILQTLSGSASHENGKWKWSGVWFWKCSTCLASSGVRFSPQLHPWVQIKSMVLVLRA